MASRGSAGGLFTTFALAFLLKGLADTRQSATVAVGGTVLGVTWIGLGLVALLALRDMPEHGRLARSRCCSRSGPVTRSRTSSGA